MKKTVVIGASTNPERYSFKAIHALVAHGIETHALGLREGIVGNIPIATQADNLSDIDTVTLYVGPSNQDNWISTIVALHPRRVIFNPGTENAEMESLLKEHGIHAEHACTLVLLATGQY